VAFTECFTLLPMENETLDRQRSISGIPFSAARISDLLTRYDGQSPSYMSYPTTSQFYEMGPQSYLDALALSDAKAALSIYIHIPFCSTSCNYCAYNKIITHQPSAVGDYLAHLKKEMALLRLQSNLYLRPVEQLHLGGGTPTFLDDAQLTQLVHTLSHYFNLSSREQRDYSIEIDPRAMGGHRIELLRGLGFNRVSLGVQDFNEQVQKAVNRELDFNKLVTLVDEIRVRGFGSLNFDMMYGLPKQSLQSLEQTLTQLIEMRPDRVSYSRYAHLPNRFPSQRAINEADLPKASLEFEMLRMIADRLAHAGYVHIGMDYYVRQTDSLAIAQAQGELCKNFQGYTINKACDLVGLGVSSISTIGGVFAQNAQSIEDYSLSLDANTLPVRSGFESKTEDTLRREIIAQLSCYGRVDILQIEQRYNLCFWEHFGGTKPALLQMQSDGLLSLLDENFLIVSPEGRFFLRNICMLFDECLR